jgi:hypothetical protein
MIGGILKFTKDTHVSNQKSRMMVIEANTLRINI